MSSLIYNSALDDEARGNINFGSDSFKCMLVTSAYVADKGAHLKRSHIDNEVAGDGYSAGGVAVAVTVTKDLVNNRVDVSLGGFSLPGATINARGAVYYKSRGGAASADELVAFIDFGSDISSSAGTWSLTASTMRTQN